MPTYLDRNALLWKRIEDAKRAALLEALERGAGDTAKAAEYLGINRAYFTRLCKRVGLKLRDACRAAKQAAKERERACHTQPAALSGWLATVPPHDEA